MPRDSGRGRALVVEDEAAIRELLRVHLALNGFDIDEIGDGRAALERKRTEPYALIVLDVMLPGIDGITVCRSVRAPGANRATPILMLTARDTESDKVIGLESGADDYLTKPFGVREFVARVSALMRRTRPTAVEPDGNKVVTRGVTLDPERRSAVIRGEPVDLPKIERQALRNQNGDD